MISLNEPSTDQRRRIRKLIWTVILVSVICHVIFGIGAGIWVIARYFNKPKAQFVVGKEVRMSPEDRRHQLAMEEVTSLRPKPVYNNRIQSLRPSKLALPQLPRVPTDNIVPLDVEALIADQVDGVGKYGNGNGNSGGFFGGAGDPKTGLLQGYLYDLKQTNTNRKIEMNDQKYLEIVDRLSKASGSAILAGYFRAPDPLYAARVAIPMIQSVEAPRAFKVDGKVEPQYWVIIYNGRMIAPKTGTFKFLGYGDDILLVRVNGRLVLDGSNQNATRLAKREGLSFTVKEGEAYDIQVIIGECPGTYFGAWLQIQEQGGTEGPYWFRMDGQDVKFTKTNLSPLHRMPGPMKNGPIWKPAPMRRSLDVPF